MANELLDAALAYVRKGWPVFPCRSDKTPYTTNGVIDATTDPKQIKAWWDTWPRANIGLDVGGAGMMVLDLDTYKPDYDPEALENDVGPLPETGLRAHSPRGGEHLFYSLGDGEIVASSASRISKHVDVRSFHGYVLLAPSSTSDGSYTWLAEDQPHYRTDELVRVANSAREKHEDRDNWLIEADLPENVASAIAWLKDSAKIAVEGQGGDAMAYATAAHLKSFGISPELAFDLMWEHWSPRCSPPWSADQADHLQQKVDNGYSYNTSPPGNVTPAYQVAKTASLFKPVATELDTGSIWTAGRFRAIDRAGMGSIKPPEWIIPEFLAENAYAMLFGARGTFKTFIALDLALSIAAGFGLGANACWPDITNAGPVLFTAGEGHASITNRVKAWEQTHFDANMVGNFVLADPVPSVAEELQPFIDTVLAASPEGYRLVVLDTVGRAMQGVNENAQEHAGQFTALVQRLQKELGATVLALHHVGHTDTDRARGSSVFGADVDTEVRLDRAGKEYLVGLTMTKQKDAAEWEKPRYVRLNEVSTDLEHKSLVAVSAKGEQMLKDVENTKQKLETAAKFSAVQNALLDHLEHNKLKEFQDTPLARAITGACGIGEQRIARHYLPELRRDSARRAFVCYDTGKARWRWQE